MDRDKTRGGTVGQGVSTARRALPLSFSVASGAGGARPGARRPTRSVPPLDPIERRVLQGMAKLWSTDEAAFMAACSPSLIRKAVRDGHLEGIKRTYYRNEGPGGRILRRVRLLVPDWALRNWMGSHFFRPTGDGAGWKQRPGRKAKGS
jgi:hypothetical protein